MHALKNSSAQVNQRAVEEAIRIRPEMFEYNKRPVIKGSFIHTTYHEQLRTEVEAWLPKM
jgi:hypothetical protein